VKPPSRPRPRGRAEAPLHQRLSLLSVVVAVLLVALLSRLWYLQVLAADHYGDLAEGNRVRQVVLQAPRGRILDRKGRVLVQNRAAWAFTVKPAEMATKQGSAVLARLARLLGQPAAKLRQRMNDWNGSPLEGTPVAEDVPTDKLFYVTEHADQFPGVTPEVLALRDYPHGKLAAHVLGYVGEVSEDELKTPRFEQLKPGDMVGKAGVELTYDRYLRGSDGVEDLEVNSAGRVVRVVGGVAPKPGADLALSIDLEVQKTAEDSLAAAMKLARKLPDTQRGGTYPAPASTAVVLDPNDGSVVALASLPEYDPRKFVGGISRKDYLAYNTDPNKPLLDRAVQSAYPPGSTWKAMSALSGLVNGAVTPQSTINCPGSFKFGNSVRHDWTPSGHGTVNLAKSLQFSCDVYYYNLGAHFASSEMSQEKRHQRVDELMQATARTLGFGRQPSIDLPYAAGGTVPDRAWRKRVWELLKPVYCKGKSALYQELCKSGYVWEGGDDLSVAIGQGSLQVSPLQLALGYGAIANGGTVYAAHVAQAVLDPVTHRPIRTVTPKISSVARIPAGDFAAVTEGLKAVPSAGTAVAAFSGFPLSRYPVGGKTGTADLPPKAPFAWFASFAPVGSPRYVVVAMVEQAGHGGESAAPVAKVLYQKLFGLPVQPLAAGADRSG
jgi:penicillin-binding protein 2